VLPHLKPEQVEGHSWLEWMTPERQAIAQAAFDRLVQTLEVQSFETLGVGPAGQPTWYLTRLSPVVRDGKLESITLVSDDITARKEASMALSASEERYRALIEQAPVPIGIHRAGRPIYTNPAHQRLFGMHALEAVDSVLDLVAPEYRQAVIERFNRRAAGDNSEPDYELIGLRRDGSRFPCRTSVVPVQLPDGPATMVFHTDLTSIRRTMDALRASEERFRTLLEQSAEGVLVIDETGAVTEWNLALERITGVSRTEALGRFAWDVLCELAPASAEQGTRDKLQASMLEALSGDPARQLRSEANIRNRRGEERGVQQTSFAIRLAGKPSLGVLFQDITERKRAEAARQKAERQLHEARKLEALGTLSGGVAHDFNNLLAVMLSNAEVLQGWLGADDPKRELVDEILSSSLRARDLVRRILSFARRQEPSRRIARLESVVGEALKTVRASLPPNVAIRFVGDPSTPQVQLDTTQLHQVVTNLATNAAHAMGNAGGTVMMEVAAADLTAADAVARPEQRPGRFARLTVRDDGHGMSSETLAHIFEPFFTTKAPGRGTGLGLSIVHGIVAAHDGFISVDSAPGHGSAFHLYFPASENAAGEQAATEIPRVTLPRALRILLVDDEEMVLRASARLLSGQGLEVSSYQQPRAALELVAAHPSRFDIALIDLSMPEMSGLELAARLSAVNPGLPILLSSGNASGVDLEQARRAGIREIIAKPYDYRTLVEAVGRINLPLGTATES